MGEVQEESEGIDLANHTSKLKARHMTRMISLRSENVKRLKTVFIEFNPTGTTMIGGRNKQGKSSALDSIAMAFGGKKLCPAQPIRDGADTASIEVDLGEVLVTRRFWRRGDHDYKSEVEIKCKEGYLAPEPQRMLNDLWGNRAFDPLAFQRMKPEEQLESLREIVGLDFTALDEEHASKYATRTAVNREVKSLKSQHDALPRFDGAPAKEISVAELMEELRKRDATNRANTEQREILTKRTEIKVRAAELVEELRQKLEQATKQLDTFTKAAESQAAAVAELVDADSDEIRTQIENSEKTNRKVRGNAQREAVGQSLKKKQEEADKITARLTEIELEKERQLKAAKFPVPGLGFSSAGITFGGLPFEQSSQAEQLRVSVAMGIAQNPKLKVMLINNGALMDDDELSLVNEMAEEAGAQVILEYALRNDKDPAASMCKVVIEDGAVKETPELAAAS